MNITTRLAGFGAALALLAAGGYTVGAAAGPAPTAPPGPTASGTHIDPHAGPVTPSVPEAAGPAVSAGGYTLAPADPTPDTGTFAFRVTGPDGLPVTAYAVEHGQPMHLIVVRRDTTGFRHVHPEMAPDGTWSVPLALPAGGSYRAPEAEGR